MSSAATRRKEDALKKQAAERLDVIREFINDPWQGYDSLEDALADYKCTTQAEVMARLLNRENVFISGPAGSGKSTLINKFIKIIDAEYQGNFEVALTASTGIAATAINGQTIHSWAGLGIDTSPFNRQEIPGQMLAKRNAIKYLDVLIIDEISMLPAYLFEKLDQVFRHFRRSDEPFGGVQVVLMGDFLQLPPVDKKEDGVNADFAATTQSWKDLNLSYCYMDKTHRASDPRLAEVLSKMSRDLVDEDVKAIVNERLNRRKSPNKTYTTLFTTNKNVDIYNQKALKENPNLSKHLLARSSGAAKEVQKLFRNNNIPETIELKVGATVLLTSNTPLPTGKFYANGSIGEVVSLTPETVRIRFNDGETVSIMRKIYRAVEKVPAQDPITGKTVKYEKEIANVEQFPLKLGYAITVHKSQGQTLDGVVVDLSQCFTPGLGYVALSRVRSLDDLIIRDISPKAYTIDPKSKRLSNFVKSKALQGRQEFIDKREDYEVILTSEMYRQMLWNVEESGVTRAADAKKKVAW